MMYQLFCCYYTNKHDGKQLLWLWVSFWKYMGPCHWADIYCNQISPASWRRDWNLFQVTRVTMMITEIVKIQVYHKAALLEMKPTTFPELARYFSMLCWADTRGKPEKQWMFTRTNQCDCLTAVVNRLTRLAINLRWVDLLLHRQNFTQVWPNMEISF